MRDGMSSRRQQPCKDIETNRVFAFGITLACTWYQPMQGEQDVAGTPTIQRGIHLPRADAEIHSTGARNPAAARQEARSPARAARMDTHPALADLQHLDGRGPVRSRRRPRKEAGAWQQIVNLFDQRFLINLFCLL